MFYQRQASVQSFPRFRSTNSTQLKSDHMIHSNRQPSKMDGRHYYTMPTEATFCEREVLRESAKTHDLIWDRSVLQDIDMEECNSDEYKINTDCLNGLFLDDVEREALEEFYLQYPTEQACADALLQARWPEGFSCPRCNSKGAYNVASRSLFQCRHCRYQASLTAGTILENTRTSLRKWFLAMFLFSRIGGINALELKQALQVTYKTAWAILSKLRYAVSHDHDNSLLSGNILINTIIYNPRLYHTVLKRGEHSVVIGGSMNSLDEPNRIIISRVEQTLKIDLQKMAEATKRFVQDRVDSSASNVQVAHKYYYNSPSLKAVIHRAASWISNTFNGIGPKHIQAYLNEYCYRFNLFQAHKLSHHTFSQPKLGRRTIAATDFSNSRHFYPRHHTINVESVLAASHSMFKQILTLCSTLPGRTIAQITQGSS